MEKLNLLRSVALEKLQSNFRKVDSLLEGKISIYLDLIRGIAAVLVLMEHLSAMLFAYSNESSIIKMVYILNLLGRPSVRVFFVLSGLFIARSIFKAIYDGRWSWNSYLINRLCRLYVVLVPALLLTFVLDRIGYISWDSPYDSVKESFVTFIGNIFFLQEILVPTFGTNDPLWSLSYEFWYYLIFPLILLTIIGRMKIITKIINIVLIILIFSFIGINISSYFLVWLMGALILFLPIIPALKSKIILFITFLLFCSSLLLRPLILTGKVFGFGENSLIFIDLFIGVAFVLFIYAMLNFFYKAKKARNEQRNLFFKISKLLSSFSFSLYLIHQPILKFVHGWALTKGFSGLKPSMISFSIEVLLVLTMLCIAWLFSRVTEAKTNKLRGLIVKNFNQQSVTSLQSKKEASA